MFRIIKCTKLCYNTFLLKSKFKIKFLSLSCLQSALRNWTNNWISHFNLTNPIYLIYTETGNPGVSKHLSIMVFVLPSSFYSRKNLNSSNKVSMSLQFHSLISSGSHIKVPTILSLLVAEASQGHTRYSGVSSATKNSLKVSSILKCILCICFPSLKWPVVTLVYNLIFSYFR